MSMIKIHSLPPVLDAIEIAELEAAEKMKIEYDSDSPEMTDDMLCQFQRMNSSV